MIEQDNRSENTHVSEFLLAEYSVLRDELVKRIELQHQTLSLGLVALGTLVPIGVQANAPIILLLYPIIIMFLAANWSHNDVRIGQIGNYIRRQIEPVLAPETRGWESSRVTGVVIGVLGSLSVFSSRGLYIFTQLCVVLFCAGLFRSSLQELEMIILFSDVGVVFFTWFIMTKARNIRLNNELREA